MSKHAVGERSRPKDVSFKGYCSIKERILANISKEESGCWKWVGKKNKTGVGVFGINRKAEGRITFLAHRAAYEQFIGEIPQGLQIAQSCRNTDCCNPEHLMAVTESENFRLRELSGRKLKRPARKTAKDHVLSFVRIDPNGCWLSIGNKDRGGYKRVYFEGKTVFLHRLSYEAFRGLIPPGSVTDHLCRTPACANPYHLELVSVKENTLRGQGPAAINSLKTHCIRGHEYSAKNTLVHKGHRHCRICNAIRSSACKTGSSL